MLLILPYLVRRSVLWVTYDVCEVELLSHDNCLALNLLITKHNFEPEELATWFLQGNIDSIGVDLLKLLITLLPSADEVCVSERDLDTCTMHFVIMYVTDNNKQQLCSYFPIAMMNYT